MPEEKRGPHRHLCKKMDVKELHDFHLVFRERIFCVLRDCGWWRDDKVQIIGLHGLIDKRTKPSNESLEEDS
mgnify:FL=1